MRATELVFICIAKNLVTAKVYDQGKRQWSVNMFDICIMIIGNFVYTIYSPLIWSK